MTTSHRGTSLRARLGVVALLFLASMLVVIGLSGLMIRSWTRAVDDRTTTLAVSDAVGDLQLAYSDQETGIRGYVLSADPVFLTPYWDGLGAETQALDALRERPTGIPSFDTQLDRVEAAAAAWRAAVATPAIDSPSEPFDEDLALEAFDEVRAELELLDQVVTAEVVDLEHRLDRVRQSALGVLVGGAVLAVGGTLLVVVMFRRWIIRPLSAISDSAVRLSIDEDTRLPRFDARELENVTAAIAVLQSSLSRERDRAITAYRGIEQSALLALQVRAELADTLGAMPPGWVADSILTPAEGVVAGDCFDVGLLDSHRLYIVMIDVTGHGAAAALNALKAKSQLRAGLRSRATPSGALALLSRENHNDDEADLLTAFVAVIDVNTGACSYASAGHPPAFLRADGDIIELNPTGPLVGAFSATWTTESVTIPEGATLLIYTDGATDAAGPDRSRFGEDRLREVVRDRPHAADLVPGVAAAVEAFTEGPRSDDLTLLALERVGCPGDASTPDTPDESDTVRS